MDAYQDILYNLQSTGTILITNAKSIKLEMQWNYWEYCRTIAIDEMQFPIPLYLQPYIYLSNCA